MRQRTFTMTGREGDKVKKFLLFLMATTLVVGSVIWAADKDDSDVLLVPGDGAQLTKNINTPGNAIVAMWASGDSSIVELSISVFPEAAAADSFSIYLVTDPLGGLTLHTFKTLTFDSIHLHRPDSLAYFSAYVDWE